MSEQTSTSSGSNSADPEHSSNGLTEDLRNTLDKIEQMANPERQLLAMVVATLALTLKGVNDLAEEMRRVRAILEGQR